MLEQLIQDYGYLAILIGTFLEGEVVLLLGGLAAHLGYLELSWVIASAFTGSVTGDQLYFFIGRRYGQRLVEKRPGWKQRSERVWPMLVRYQNLAVLGFRFVYGMRTIAPFVIGMSAISTLRYVVLNLVGAAVWATAFAWFGYLFGEVAAQLLGKVERYEMTLFGTILGVAAASWVWRIWRRRHSG